MGAYNKRGGHATIIRDDVVERIVRELGYTSLGVYAMLERRVGADGRTTVSYGTLAESGDMARRHMIRIVSGLIAAGFVVSNGRDGNSGISVFLPYHYGSDTGGDTGSDTGGDTHIYISRVTSTEVTSSQGNQSNTRTRSATLSPVPEADEIDRERWVEEAVRIGIERPRTRWLEDQFRDYWKANGGRKKDWLAAWRVWCRNDMKWNGQRESAKSGLPATVVSVEEALERRRAQRAQEG